jgi:hypothetical protein
MHALLENEVNPYLESVKSREIFPHGGVVGTSVICVGGQKSMSKSGFGVYVCVNKLSTTPISALPSVIRWFSDRNQAS